MQEQIVPLLGVQSQHGMINPDSEEMQLSELHEQGQSMCQMRLMEIQP